MEFHSHCRIVTAILTSLAILTPPHSALFVLDSLLFRAPWRTVSNCVVTDLYHMNVWLRRAGATLSFKHSIDFERKRDTRSVFRHWFYFFWIQFILNIEQSKILVTCTLKKTMDVNRCKLTKRCSIFLLVLCLQKLQKSGKERNMD